MSAATAQQTVESIGGHLLRRFGVGVNQFSFAPGAERAAVAKLRADPNIRYAEPDYLEMPSGLPNDPGFPNQWAERNTGQTVNGTTGTPGADADVAPAWNVTPGSRNVVVADVDTGVDYNHPDLAANIWTNPGGVNGCSAGTHGFNVLTGVCDPMDDDTVYGGHGTHVAGIIGAVGNNGIGIAGINWTTTILPVKWIPSSGAGATSDLIRALDWVMAAKNAGVNVRVVNDSNVFVGTAYSQALSDELDALRQHDILFVTAAGNTGQDDDNPAYRRYPCGYARANELCVTMTDQSNGLGSGANFGASTVDLAAPGTNIYSTLRNGTYGYISGGSMAAAAVSGAAALVLAVGDMSSGQLKADLLEHAKPLASLTGKVRTGGLLDVCAAVPGCGTTTSGTGTFGKTTVGGSSDRMSADRKRVNSYPLNVPATLQKLSMYLAPTGVSGSQSLAGVVYADAGGAPGALLGQTQQIAFSSAQQAGWYDLPFATGLSLNPGKYWIGVISGSTGGVTGFRWSSVAGSRVYNTNSYSAGPSNPFGVGTTDSEQMSLFATYQTTQPAPFAVTPPAVTTAQSQPAHPSPEPQAGMTVTGSTGDWDFNPTAYSYQWSRCDATGHSCAALTAATTPTYTVTAADVGATLRVTVTASTGSASTASASVPTLVVQAAPPAGTFGKTAVGATSDPADANWERVDAFTAPATGTITKITIYLARIAAGAQVLRGAIYADSGGTPGALLAVTGDVSFGTTASSGWYDLALPAPISVTAGATYWLGAQFGSTTRVVALRYDESTAGSGAVAPATFSSPPVTSGWRPLQFEQTSVYATYG